MNAVSSRMNDKGGEIEKFNAKFEQKYGKDWFQKYGDGSKQQKQYFNDYEVLYGKIYTEELIKRFGERPV